MEPITGTIIGIGAVIIGAIAASYIWRWFERWAEYWYSYLKQYVYERISGYEGWRGSLIRAGWGICCRVMDAAYYGFKVASRLYDLGYFTYDVVMIALAELRDGNGVFEYEAIEHENVPYEVHDEIQEEGVYTISLS